eukprot:scaffold25947_cov163-Isochrysis_galbana.AAC.1
MSRKKERRESVYCITLTLTELEKLAAFSAGGGSLTKIDVLVRPSSMPRAEHCEGCRGKCGECEPLPFLVLRAVCSRACQEIPTWRTHTKDGSARAMADATLSTTWTILALWRAWSKATHATPTSGVYSTCPIGYFSRDPRTTVDGLLC